MCLLSRFPCRFEIQDWTDAAKRNLEKGRKKEESSEARMNRFFFCAVARWQIAGAGRWKQEKTTDLLYSTLLQEMDSTRLSLPLSLLFSMFLSSVPVSEWCIRVRRGWVLGGSERPAPTHRGWDTWGGQGRIWRGEIREPSTAAKKRKKRKVSAAGVFWAQVENEVEYLSNTRVKVGWSLTAGGQNI